MRYYIYILYPIYKYKICLRELCQVVKACNFSQFVVIEIQLLQCLQSRHRIHVWNEILTKCEYFDLCESNDDLWDGLEPAVGQIDFL